MAANYWRIDFYNIKTGEIVKGSIKYASEFKACQEANKLSNLPSDMKIKITKCQFNS